MVRCATVSGIVMVTALVLPVRLEACSCAPGVVVVVVVDDVDDADHDVAAFPPPEDARVRADLRYG